MQIQTTGETCADTLLCRTHTAHLQDTGGFFIAVLQKVAPTPPLEDPQMGHRWERLCAGALPSVCAWAEPGGAACVCVGAGDGRPLPSVLLLLV